MIKTEPPLLLETPRLYLRPPRIEDASAIFNGYAQDPDISRFLIWRPHENLGTTKEFLARCLEAWRNSAAFPWVIIERQAEKLIGMVEVRVRGHHADLGYVLERSSWDKGYGTEAVGVVTQWAIAQPTIHRVWAACDVENPASARVLEKVGMEREGLLRRWAIHPNISSTPRDCWCYSIVK